MGIQDFVGIQEIAELLNRTVEEIEDLVDRKEISFHRDLVIGDKHFALAFPKQEVLSRIEPRKKKPPKTTETPKETK